MSYIECSQCGQRALSIATRCPRCGHEFLLDSLQRRAAAKPTPSTTGATPRVVGALIVVAVLVGVVWIGSRLIDKPSAETPAPPEPSVTSQLGRSAVDSSYSQGSSGGSQSLRYATTWINVRERRGMSSPVAWVLDPGEAVLVDSLVRGWYRVVVDGQVLGYAARTNFDSSPPSSER